MKKTILLVAINYNSYLELYDYLDSINSNIFVGKYFSIDIYIVDNSSIKQTIDVSRYSNLNLNIVPANNLGYLGGAFYILNNKIDPKKYDFTIISNVDVIISSDFFIHLFNITHNDIGWIAPSIFSESENRDRNPKIYKRYSKAKLLLLYYMYKYPLLHFLYQKSFYKRKKIKTINEQRDIYAGHGSFMIFTRVFFLKKPNLNYPVFLFGEEIFFAELMKKYSLRVTYIPNIRIFDKEHISTSKMSSKFYYKCNREAIKYIISNFYE